MRSWAYHGISLGSKGSVTSDMIHRTHTVFFGARAASVGRDTIVLTVYHALSAHLPHGLDGDTSITSAIVIGKAIARIYISIALDRIGSRPLINRCPVRCFGCRM